MKRKISYKVLAVITIVVQAISLIPVLYCSLFDYATGDDLGYSAAIHQLMQNGGSLAEILQAMNREIANSWYGYQGTWSSIFLFQLQPGIWGERVYSITVWLALACIFTGVGYLMYELLCRRMGVAKDLFIIIYNILLILMTQFMPKIRGGLFWYTSVVHYILPFCAALLAMGWSVRYLETGKWHYLIFCVLIMSYLGGAGYPLIVLAAAWLFFLILGTWTGVVAGTNGQQAKMAILKERAARLLIPLFLEMIGFVISAVAPGNKVRGGSDFGFSLGRVAETVGTAFVNELGSIRSFICGYHFLFLIILIVMIMLFWNGYDVSKSHLSLQHPLLAALAAFVTSSAVRMPAIYANVAVSGGVPDVEFFTSVLMLYLTAIYLTACVKKKRKDTSVSLYLGKTNNIAVLVMVLFSIFYCIHYSTGTSDRICWEYIRSGQLHDFEQQMEERLAILEDPSIMDAVVPEMNPEQGPIMHMALTSDPKNFTNTVTAEYYGKEMVIALPREEYERLVRQSAGN